MSYSTFFSFAQGLAKPVQVPKGTKSRVLSHIQDVEETLELKKTQYKNNPPHWDHFDSEYAQGFPSVTDDVLCTTVQDHNQFVRQFYHDLGAWTNAPVVDGDVLTPEDAQEFWHGLELLFVPPDRWTKEYYRAQMETLYEVMRGRPSDGIVFDTDPLTPQQADAVITLFADYLDTHDIRLSVPVGHDFLASSHDGEYEWCEVHGAIYMDDLGAHKTETCPLAEELRAKCDD